MHEPRPRAQAALSVLSQRSCENYRITDKMRRHTIEGLRNQTIKGSLRNNADVQRIYPSTSYCGEHVHIMQRTNESWANPSLGL